MRGLSAGGGVIPLTTVKHLILLKIEPGGPVSFGSSAFRRRSNTS
ncbi:MAG: hypothetical protein QW057_02040 [Candidatus Bathyarchaeia archaeon]